MNKLRFAFNLTVAVALSALVTGCLSALQQKQNLLTTAGFRNVLATTPQQKTLLASLPPDKMSVVQTDGKAWFVYPNIPQGSAFVGTEAQYNTYRQMASAQRTANENTMNALNRGTNWNSWGGGWGWR